MSANVFKTLGASNHCSEEREENDFYATNPKDVELLFSECNIQFNENILEPCAGLGQNGDKNSGMTEFFG